MDGWMDGWMDAWIDGAWMVGWMDGCKWVSVMATERRLFCISFILIKLSLWKLKIY